MQFLLQVASPETFGYTLIDEVQGTATKNYKLKLGKNVI
jgi:hypothetical protein